MFDTLFWTLAVVFLITMIVAFITLIIDSIRSIMGKNSHEENHYYLISEPAFIDLLRRNGEIEEDE